MSDLYKRIESLCEEKGITITQMCKECGASRGSLGDLANSRIQSLSANTLEKIANYFKVSTDYLTGKSRYRNIQEVKDYNWGVDDDYFEAPFDFARLLKERREYMDISLSALGQTIGANEEQMEAIEDGFLPINYDQAEKLCSYLGTNVSQVLFDNELYTAKVPEEYHDNVREWERIQKELDDEAMRDSEDAFSVSSNERIMLLNYRSLDYFGKKAVDELLTTEYNRCTAPHEKEEPKIKIKHSCYKVSAGRGFEFLAEEEWDEIDVPDTADARKADFALTIQGDSMEPIFLNGDIVLVKQQDAVDLGQIGIFILNGFGYIKKFAGDRLISLNEKYDDILISEYDKYYCIGKVIGRV